MSYAKWCGLAGAEHDDHLAGVSATLLFVAQADGSKADQCRRRGILPDPRSDPLERQPALERAVLQLLGVAASRRVATTTGSDTGVADSKILAARQQLSELVALHKLATGRGQRRQDRRSRP